VTAALNIALNPSQNVGTLRSYADPTSPFQSVLTTLPAAWTVAIQYAPAGLSAPTGIAADQAGNIWLANSTSNSVTLLAPTGAPTATYASGQAGSGAIAIDLGGNAWVASKSSGSILKVTNAGVVSTYSGGGLSTTNAIAIDGTGNVWAAGTGTVLSGFSSSGTALSAGGYTGGGVSNAQSIAITPH
jgi:streptogramin lyase